ncbi:MAG TPA: ATP-binding protein [Bryobacteraceae bacterium]|jgi:signal transduction histidine kinase/CheY-like chemotaxis protein
MTLPLLTLTIRSEHDTVAARQRARLIARLLGFDTQDQTRISTAVSEIARNSYNYAGGGRVEYLLEGRTPPQLFIVKMTDAGPGIRDLDTILEGRYQSPTGMGLGILGAQRLMDQFQVDSVPGKGTTIWLKKLLPSRARLVRDVDVSRIADALAEERPQDPLQEMQYQNQELLAALQEIQTRQTELIRLNREMEDTNRGVVALYAELDEQADHLRRADQLKSRFLSNMSHEFRSPLNSILALTGLLHSRSSGDLSPDQDQQVGYIKRAAHDLLDLVNDLLDLAKVEAGKVEAKPLEFDVINLFAALRGMLRPLLLNQSLDLVFENVGDIPLIYSDEGKVSQILRNFISNSLKFTEKGAIRVSAALTGPDEVSFSVSDTGIGIAAEDQKQIFEDFVQLDHPIQKRVKGTGLGLPLSKKLAGLLGGRITVESRLGEGSTFTLYLPLRYRDAAEEPVTSPAMWVPDPQKIPVLIVEDSPEIVAIYRNFLAQTRFQMVVAATTRNAETLVNTIRPRIIVLDILLRSEDAWGFLARLKSGAATKDIPIVVASTIEDQAKAFHLGADRYLVKPVERIDLLDQLETLATKGTKILIIDDQERDRYILRQELANSLVSIVEASNGTLGIALARQDRPNLIFLDLTMPDMTGFEVLRELSRDASTANVPVIVVTSRVLTETERAVLMQHTVAIIDKAGLAQANMTQVVSNALNREGPSNGSPITASTTK